MRQCPQHGRADLAVHVLAGWIRVVRGLGNRLIEATNSAPHDSGPEDCIDAKRLVHLLEPFGAVGGSAQASLLKR
jgi:hypothetical protein